MRNLSDYPDAHLRVFDRPGPPETVRSVYLIGICGKGMGALAELLVQAGYQVSGSDEAAYPPMSTRLAALGISIREGYGIENLAAARPDVVVVGNTCGPTHPEATFAREQRLPQMSLPEAIAHFAIGDRRSLVIAGTHGKTSTTGMLISILLKAGVDPGFLVGGIMSGVDQVARLGTGPHFAIEGDEYDAAYFDKRPKMLLYRPSSAVITSMEFDHADIYEDWDDYREAFLEFCSLIPPSGVLAMSAHEEALRELASTTEANVVWYGIPEQMDGRTPGVSASELRISDGRLHFTISHGRRVVGPTRLSVGGRINVLNALAATALALHEGISDEAILTGLEAFGGMKRRQEIVGERGGVTIVDDFAHHPTAVEETVRAVSERWPNRRIVAMFEPRSNSSRRKVFQDRYVDALAGADRVLLSVPPVRHNDSPDDFLDAEELAAGLRLRGTPAEALPDPDAVFTAAMDELREGDLALVMSSGSFGELPSRLVAGLSRSESPAAG